MASAMAVDMADLDCLVEPDLVATLRLFEYSIIRTAIQGFMLAADMPCPYWHSTCVFAGT